MSNEYDKQIRDELMESVKAVKVIEGDKLPELLKAARSEGLDLGRALGIILYEQAVLVFEENVSYRFQIVRGKNSTIHSIQDSLESAGVFVYGAIDCERISFWKNLWMDAWPKEFWLRIRNVIVLLLMGVVVMFVGTESIKDISSALLAVFGLLISVFAIMGFERILSRSSRTPLSAMMRMYDADSYLLKVACMSTVATLLALLIGGWKAFSDILLWNQELGWYYRKIAKILTLVSVIGLYITLSAITEYYLDRIRSEIETDAVMDAIAKRFKSDTRNS